LNHYTYTTSDKSDSVYLAWQQRLKSFRMEKVKNKKRMPTICILHAFVLC
jgi:hypothetical protein